MEEFHTSFVTEHSGTQATFLSSSLWAMATPALIRFPITCKPGARLVAKNINLDGNSPDCLYQTVPKICVLPRSYWNAEVRQSCLDFTLSHGQYNILIQACQRRVAEARTTVDAKLSRSAKQFKTGSVKIAKEFDVFEADSTNPVGAY